MARAILKNAVIAESDDIQVIEGNTYFPPDSIKREFFKPSETHSICPWKGIASYLDVVIDGDTIKDGAWYYPEPKQKAAHFKDFVAFWRGVVIEES